MMQRIYLRCRSFKADTHEGFCFRSMLQDHFARVSTHEGALFAPEACSQVFSRLSIVEHFAEWKFCSRGSSIPMESLANRRSVPEKTPRVYRPLSLEEYGLKNLDLDFSRSSYGLLILVKERFPIVCSPSTPGLPVLLILDCPLPRAEIWE